jgi:hypothetical protein
MRDVVVIHTDAGLSREIRLPVSTVFSGSLVGSKPSDRRTTRYSASVCALRMAVDRTRSICDRTAWAGPLGSIQRWINRKAVEDIGDAIQTVAKLACPGPLTDRTPRIS